MNSYSENVKSCIEIWNEIRIMVEIWDEIRIEIGIIIIYGWPVGPKIKISIQSSIQPHPIYLNYRC